MRFLVTALLASMAMASATIIDSSAALKELQLRASFTAYKSAFGKAYITADVEEKRFGFYKQNMLASEQLNIEIPTAQFGETKFSDLSPEEFSVFFKGYKKTQYRDLPIQPVTAGFQAPLEVDWFALGYTTPVKDQGQCGSCWAFSAVQGVESAWAVARNLTGSMGSRIPVLAPEQVVDCDKVDAGCNGGDLPPAYQYIQKAGLTLESLYPYTAGKTGKATACRTNITAVATIQGFVYASPPCTNAGNCNAVNEETLRDAVAQTGPSAICVNASGKGGVVWQNYRGGVVTGETKTVCPAGWFDLDHCVLLTGYGKDNSTGYDYWNVKNSWGSGWGEKGFIRLQRGNNMCGVADEATFVRV